MVCGHLLETFNTSGPLLSNKILCPYIKSIENQKNFHRNVKGFFSRIRLKFKTRSSRQFEGIFLASSIKNQNKKRKKKVFTAIWYCVRPEFEIYCTEATFSFNCPIQTVIFGGSPLLMSRGPLGGLF